MNTFNRRAIDAQLFGEHAGEKKRGKLFFLFFSSRSVTAQRETASSPNSEIASDISSDTLPPAIRCVLPSLAKTSWSVLSSLFENLNVREGVGARAFKDDLESSESYVYVRKSTFTLETSILNLFACSRQARINAISRKEISRVSARQMKPCHSN